MLGQAEGLACARHHIQHIKEIQTTIDDASRGHEQTQNLFRKWHEICTGPPPIDATNQDKTKNGNLLNQAEMMNIKKLLLPVHTSSTHVFYDPNRTETAQSCMCDLPHRARFYGQRQGDQRRLPPLRQPTSRNMDRKQAEWYLRLFQSYLDQYVSYMVKELGCVHVFLDDLTRTVLKPEAVVVSSGVLAASTAYLALSRVGGSMLLQVELREEFVTVTIYTLDWRRLSHIINERLFLFVTMQLEPLTRCSSSKSGVGSR